MSVWLTDPSVFEPTYQHPFYPAATFHTVGPTADEVVRDIRELARVGVRHFAINFEDMVTLERFRDEVLPALDDTG